MTSSLCVFNFKNCRGLKIAIDIAAGLAYLHKRRVVHLDLKSSNILLTGDVEPKAKISDVGIARIMPGSQEYITGGAGGTWHWCSPEVILGQKCTAAADIWSFGVVLVGLLLVCLLRLFVIVCASIFVGSSCIQRFLAQCCSGRL